MKFISILLIAAALPASAKTKRELLGEVPDALVKTECAKGSALMGCYKITPEQCASGIKKGVASCGTSIAEFPDQLAPAQEAKARENLSACLLGTVRYENLATQIKSPGCQALTMVIPARSFVRDNFKQLPPIACGEKAWAMTCFNMKKAECEKSVAALEPRVTEAVVKKMPSALSTTEEMSKWSQGLVDTLAEEYGRANEKKLATKKGCDTIHGMREKFFAMAAKTLPSDLCKAERFRSCYKVTDAECTGGLQTAVKLCRSDLESFYPGVSQLESRAEWEKSFAQCVPQKFMAANKAKLAPPNEKCK